jgi:cytosine deaminase
MMREEWRGRIELQAACLTSIDTGRNRGMARHRRGDRALRRRARHGDLSGSRRGRAARSVLPHRAGARSRRRLPRRRNPRSRKPHAPRHRRGQAPQRLRGPPALAGHCCSLSAQPEAEALETIARVAEEGIDVVSLPMCNMYLQDAPPPAPPRWRGVTLVHELKQPPAPASPSPPTTPATRSTPMAISTWLEVMREATRIAHLDHPFGDWPKTGARKPRAVRWGWTPTAAGSSEGGPADFVICEGRSWTVRSCRGRKAGASCCATARSSTTPPDYAELDTSLTELHDHLME